MKIIPAILESDKVAYEQKFAMATSLCDRVQIDIVDGVFAKNKTIKVEDISKSFYQDYQIELDLMVAYPSKYLEIIKTLQPNLVIFHLECSEPLDDIVGKLQGSGIKAGVAINPATSINKVAGFTSKLDQLLVMGVVAGFSGQKFDEQVIAKLKEIKQKQQSVEIGVDGGMNTTTLAEVATAGADVAYVNTALFENPSPQDWYEQITEQFA